MRESDGGRVHVENLSHEPIRTIDDAVRLIARGTANRTTAGTSTNAESSRSHAVFTLKLTAEMRGDDGVKRQRTYASFMPPCLSTRAHPQCTCLSHMGTLAGATRVYR